MNREECSAQVCPSPTEEDSTPTCDSRRQPGMTLADFELLRRIGDGSYSHVVLARHRGSGRRRYGRV